MNKEALEKELKEIKQELTNLSKNCLNTFIDLEVRINEITKNQLILNNVIFDNGDKLIENNEDIIERTIRNFNYENK